MSASHVGRAVILRVCVCRHLELVGKTEPNNNYSLTRFCKISVTMHYAKIINYRIDEHSHVKSLGS